MAGRRATGLLLACALAAFVPPARAVAEPPPVENPVGAFRRALETAARQSDGSFDFHYTMPVGDLAGDGRQDLLAHRWELTPADAGIGYDGTLTVTAIAGSTGRRLWRWERDLTNSLPFPSAAARVGPGGSPGAIVFVDTHTPSYEVTAIGVDAHGTQVWEQSFASTYTPVTPFTATGLPTGFYLGDAVAGRADDLFVGVLDYADAVARLRVMLVDGAEGTTTQLGPTEVSTGAFPAFSTAGDLDADGRDDYVVVGRSPADAGHVVAYSGVDGTELWSQAGLDLGEPYLWSMAGGDLTGDGAAEIVVSAPPNGDREAFHVLDGASGEPMWDGEGTFPYPLGDAGRDGSVDLGVTSAWQTESRTNEEFRAYAPDGSLLYGRVYSSPLPDCDGSPCPMLTFLLDAGDFDADGTMDLVVDRYGGDERTLYLVRGRDGRKHLPRLAAVPLMRSLDGRGDDVVRIRPARGGSVRVTALDARDGDVLWKVRLRGSVVGAQEPYRSAASLAGGRRADVFVTRETKRGTVVTALDGRSGATLWSHRL